MKLQKLQFVDDTWNIEPSEINHNNAQLVLAFGSRELLVNKNHFDHIKKNYPNANIVMCSTAGEVINGYVYDNSIVATAIEFEKSSIKTAITQIDKHKNSFDAGVYLNNQLKGDKLAGIFVISDGIKVEGDLVRGLSLDNTHKIPITGGFAGDGVQFQKTITGLNEIPSEGNIIAVGFYGDNISMGHGSMGGWDEFGFERYITKSKGNVMFEIDGENALDLYKKYLGSFSKDLPGSALMFPLSMYVEGSTKRIIRTILAVDEEKKALIFAGDVPEKSKIKLMRGNLNRLIEASATAAKDSLLTMNSDKPDLTILISCVGRKIILGSRVNEEIDVAEEVIGNTASIIGFYSYGGISPLDKGGACELHNQTMTITTFKEV